MARLAVFCGSSTQVSPIFFSEAERFGRLMAEMGHQLVYGGSNVGLMGVIADAVIAGKGHVIGVVPDMDFSAGIVHQGLHEKFVVQNLWQRKAKMLELADAVVVFPGGLGTLDEATDALVLKVTGEFKKKILFLNLHGFWEPFLEALTLMVQQRMILSSLEDLYEVHDSSANLLTRVNGGDTKHG